MKNQDGPEFGAALSARGSDDVVIGTPEVTRALDFLPHKSNQDLERLEDGSTPETTANRQTSGKPSPQICDKTMLRGFRVPHS